MLNHTFYTDPDFSDIITDDSERFYAFLMPGGGWVVRDLNGQFTYDGPSDRCATVEEADALIGQWLTTPVAPARLRPTPFKRDKEI